MLILLTLLVLNHFICNCCSTIAELNNSDPKFSEPINNVTVPVGRDGTLKCVVHDLMAFKVAWLRVDTQTILSIQNHVITKNHRISISHTEHRIWQLRIRDVRESDRGWYMCQINTDPMKSQVGFLDVVVPPDIIDYQTSNDQSVQEGQNVTLTCTAVGQPTPTIVWRREKDLPLNIFTAVPMVRGSRTDGGGGGGGSSGVGVGVGSGAAAIAVPATDIGHNVYSVEGPNLTLWQVQRQHMGAYLCIASNGVPPTVSKRITLTVHFMPSIWTRYDAIYVGFGQKVVLECISEAQPMSVNFWLKDKDYVQGGTYETLADQKLLMRLIVRPLKIKDFGDYRCIAKNMLGEAERVITVHHKAKKDVQHAHQSTERGNQLILIEEFIVSAATRNARLTAHCYAHIYLYLQLFNKYFAV